MTRMSAFERRGAWLWRRFVSNAASESSKFVLSDDPPMSKPSSAVFVVVGGGGGVCCDGNIKQTIATKRLLK